MLFFFVVVIKESCLHSCLSFQDFRRYMGCIIEMKAGQYARTSCYFFGICFLRTVPPCQNFLYSVLFPGLELNGEWSGDFSGEASTRQNHLVTDPSHLSQSISPSLSFILHLSHPPPACQNHHNRASIFLSISPLACSFHFLLSPAPRLPPPNPPPWYWSCPARNYFASVSD